MNLRTSLSRTTGVLCLAAFAACVTSAAAQAVSNPQLAREIQFIRYLGDELMMPDYAEIVLGKVKERFPEATAVLKVLQIEQQLAQGKFDEVQKIIAAEKDPESPETWAMKSTMADYYFAFGRYDEAFGIYQGLYKKYGDKPPEALGSFYLNSLYKYAQMLLRTKRDKLAVGVYEAILKLPMEKPVKRQFQFEYAELLINVAEAEKEGSKERTDFLAKGEKACKDVLWDTDLWFAKGVALLARIRVLKGDLEGAQKLVKGYLPTIKQIDDALMAQGRELGEDYSSVSPVAQIRYLTGRMYYEEAKKLLAAAGEGDIAGEQKTAILKLLVGSMNPQWGLNADAYNELINVAVQYPGANDAPEAMALAEEIEELLVNRRLIKGIQKSITPEQRARVSHSQFENARVSFNQQLYDKAAARYESILNQYPREIPDSINGLSELARCYIALYDPAKDDTSIYALYADAAVGQLAETFCNGLGMEAAGEELRRIADFWVSEKGNQGKHDAVLERFYSLYKEHSAAAPLIWAGAEQAFQAEDYDTALAGFTRLANDYLRSPLSNDALLRIAAIHKERENVEGEIEACAELRKRLEATGKPSARLVGVIFQQAQARRSLAKPEDLRSEDAAVVAAAQKNLLAATKDYQAVTKILDDPAKAPLYAATDEEAEKNLKLHENAYMGIAGCYSALASMNLPEDKVAALRKAAVDAYENTLAKFPKTENGAGILNRIGTLWTTAAAKAADDAGRKDANDKATSAFERLSKSYPDSEEAKLALFMQGRALIELGFASEGREKFVQMFKDTSKYTASQMLSVGDSLREGRQTDLAIQAYDDAEKRSADNEAVRQRARFGRAFALSAQKDKLAESVQALEAFVQEYPKSALALDANLQLSRSASTLAADPSQKDAKERDRLFGSAVTAMKEVRKYYNARVDEIDKRARENASEEGDADEKTRLSGKLAETDNDIGDIIVRQSKAADAAGDKDGATRYRRQAIAHFIPVVESYVATAPDAAVRSPHVQKSFSTIVDLMMQSKEYEDAANYADLYLQNFPAGLYAGDIRAKASEARANQ